MLTGQMTDPTTTQYLGMPSSFLGEPCPGHLSNNPPSQPLPPMLSTSPPLKLQSSWFGSAISSLNSRKSSQDPQSCILTTTLQPNTSMSDTIILVSVLLIDHSSSSSSGQTTWQ